MNAFLKSCHSMVCNHGRFLSNAGLMAGAELVNRLTRIAAAIALAWTMSIVEFGIAAAALTVHELVRLLVQNGLGARIVVAGPQELASTTAAVHRLNWFVGFAMASVQCLLAWLIGLHFGDMEVAFAVATMAIVHIIYPAAMVQVYLAQREDRWKTVSFAVAAQCATDNLLTAALALTGFGLWAVAIPKLIRCTGVGALASDGHTVAIAGETFERPLSHTSDIWSSGICSRGALGSTPPRRQAPGRSRAWSSCARHLRVCSKRCTSRSGQPDDSHGCSDPAPHA